MLSRKQPRTARRLLELTLKVKTDGQEKRSQSEVNQVRESLLFGVTNGLKTGFVDKLLSGFTDTWNTDTDFGSFEDIIFHFSLNKLGGPVAIYNASSQAASIRDSGSLVSLAILY